MSYHPPGQGYPYQNPQQQQGYPPPQQQQGNPPYQGYAAAPNQQQYPQYQHPQQGFPPQGQFQQPPAGYPAQPVQQGYGAPHPGQHPQQHVYPPTPASPGYNPHMRAQGNAGADADLLRKAMKGFGTDEKTLIRILSKPDPLQMALLRETYQRNHKRDLESDVRSETSGDFEEALCALISGPLMQDVLSVREAVKGMGTNEVILNDVLLNRSNADMDAIKAAYKSKFNRDLEADVADDLSQKTGQLFRMILSKRRNEESMPIDQQTLDLATNLHRATERKTADTMEVCAILSSLSNGQIRAVAHHFQQKYQVSLVEKIKDRTMGHMEDALVLLVERAVDPVMSDAVQIEAAMSGLGTKDKLLINRIVRAHWDRAHKDQVKRAYMAKYKKDLISRVKGETRGDYEKLLVACLE